MWLDVGCRLEMEYTVATPMILLLRPRSGDRQWVAEEVYRTEPEVAIREYTDGFENLCQRLVAPPGVFRVETRARVRLEVQGATNVDEALYVPVEDLPNATLGYLMPSRYCESDRLGALATEQAAGCRPGGEQVRTLTDWVTRQLRYAPDSDPGPLSAAEVYRRGEGVCRDFAHLGIALCRSLSIPARMAAGYVEGLDPMDLHAWFEAYIGGRWHTFDASPHATTGGRVVVAYGRDAADVPVFNQFGPPVTPSRMDVHVQRIDP